MEGISPKNHKSKKKVFIGYSNIAGNSSILTKVLRNQGYRANFYYISTHTFGYDEEKIGRRVFFTKYGKINRLLYVLYAVYFILKNNIFIFSGQNTLLPSHKDLKLIKMFNKKIIFLFTGCDTRDYRWFLDSYDYKYNICKMCTDEYKKLVNCKIETKIEIVKLAEKYSDLIIAHPHYDQLFTKKYEYFWVPIDIETPQTYSPYYRTDENFPLKIIHAPSHIDVKGTKYIEEAVNRLKSEGFKIDYERIQNLSNEDVLGKIMECDVAVDQLYVLHGLFGVEAMKFSKPMICYVDKFFLDKLPKDLPFIDANPDTIFDVLKDLYKNRTKLEYYGNKSRNYVLEHHDANNVIRRWMEIIDN